MRICRSFTVLLSTLLLASGVKGAQPDKPNNADVGREFALVACTGCHVVAANQRFAPLLPGAPDFSAIANRPDVTAASLRRRLATLPHIPSKGHMGNPELTEADLANVIAYIMSIRQQRAD